MQNRNRKTATRRAPSFELSAGVQCLDFVNTLDDRPSSEPKELLAQYEDLARFGEDTEILEPEEADRLVAFSKSAPSQAQRALRAAVQLREAMYAIFWAVIHKKPAPSAAVSTLNQFVQLAARHSRLVETRRHFEWRFDSASDDLEAPLWAITRSAAELLASDQLAFVRACSSQTCQWLFLDTSKNHRRRWCDMKLCGNRAKVARFYNRQKQGA
jgi:predicted RNA-binding Zn ribbon-like protein